MHRIHGLDGLRTIAVALVVLAHLNVIGSLKASGLISAGAAEISDAGVHLFFVLSGFLITIRLIQEHRQNGKISLRNFYFNRACRILPLYFLVVTLILIAEILGDTRTGPTAFVMAYAFLSNFIARADYSGILGHTWSLAVEEHFYVIWPLLFLTYYAHRRRRLLHLVAAFSFAAIALRGMLSLTDLNQKFFIYRWTITAGGSIGFGCIMAMLLTSDDWKEKTVRIVGGSGGVAIALGLIFHSALYQIPIAWSIPARAFGAAILIGWVYLNQRSVAVRVLEFAPIRYIGIISYGVYMWQGFFLSTGPARAATQTWPPDQMTGFLLLLLVAPLSYHFFEKPFLRAKKRTFDTAPEAPIRGITNEATR